jgi:hypothetical protein
MSPRWAAAHGGLANIHQAFALVVGRPFEPLSGRGRCRRFCGVLGCSESGLWFAQEHEAHLATHLRRRVRANEPLQRCVCDAYQLDSQAASAVRLHFQVCPFYVALCLGFGRELLGRAAEACADGDSAFADGEVFNAEIPGPISTDDCRRRFANEDDLSAAADSALASAAQALRRAEGALAAAELQADQNPSFDTFEARSLAEEAREGAQELFDDAQRRVTLYGQWADSELAKSLHGILSNALSDVNS